MTPRAHSSTRGTATGAADPRAWWARSAPRPRGIAPRGGEPAVVASPAAEWEADRLDAIASAVLTVSAPALTRTERAFCELLGRVAGGALAVQRARDLDGQGRAPMLAA